MERDLRRWHPRRAAVLIRIEEGTTEFEEVVM